MWWSVATRAIMSNRAAPGSKEAKLVRCSEMLSVSCSRVCDSLQM